MSDLDSINQEKRQALDELLNSDDFVLTHVDPVAAAVVLPAYLKENQTLTLKLSRYFRGTMTLEDDQVKADLLFGSEYFTCCVPYAAIWGLTGSSGQNRIWPDSAPDSVIRGFIKSAFKPDAEKPDVPRGPTLIKQGESRGKAKAPKPRPDYLRRVK